MPKSTLASLPFRLITCFPQIPSIEQYAMRAFASALDSVPLALAENSGLSPIETLAEVKSRQVNENDSKLGIDCSDRGENGMFHPRPLQPFAKRCFVAGCVSRYEETIRVRSIDFEEATIPAGNPACPGCTENRSVIPYIRSPRHRAESFLSLD